jgi:hypothetical protein
MQTGDDVAGALRHIAGRLTPPGGTIREGNIRDVNGNTVGTYSFADSARAAAIASETMGDGFTLVIELGNAAMLGPRNVAPALSKVAGRLESGETDGRIMDVNGNSVGNWNLGGFGRGRSEVFSRAARSRRGNPVPPPHAVHGWAKLNRISREMTGRDYRDLPDDGPEQDAVTGVYERDEDAMAAEFGRRGNPTQWTVRNHGTSDEYMQRTGAWGPYKTARRFSSQNAAERFADRFVPPNSYGLFPTGPGRRSNPDAEDVEQGFSGDYDRLESGDTEGRIMDLNGNGVGNWNLSELERRGNPTTTKQQAQRDQMIRDILEQVENWDQETLVSYAQEKMEAALQATAYRDLVEEWKQSTGRG